MNTPVNNEYMRYMATRYGSGLQAEVSEAGGSRFAEELIDAYAVAGRVMDPQLAANVQRYDQIIRNEGIMLRSSPSARAALSGAGYDAFAVREEAGALRRQIYEQSADARNVQDRVALQAAQQQLAQMELNTQRMYATQDARVQAELAQLNTARMTAEQQGSALEVAAQTTAALQAARDNGLDLQAMEEIFASNDTQMMQSAFGTSSRAVAYETLRAARAMDREDTRAQIEGLASAATLQSVQLASQFDADALNAMLEDPNQRPANVSDMAIMGALGQHAQAMQGQQTYQEALAAGIVNEQELTQLAVNSLRDDEIIAALHGAIAQAGGSMTMEQFATATSGAGLNALADDLMAATQNGQMPVTVTVAGQQMELPAMELLSAYSRRMEQADATAATQIMQAQDLQVMMREHQESARQLNTMAAMIGLPIPQQLQLAVERATNDARILATQATRPGTSPEMRQQFMAAYEEQMNNTRQMVVDYARQNGVSQALLDDVQAGRFSSSETYRGGIIDALAMGATETNSIIATAAQGYFREQGVERQHVQDWLTSASEDLEDINAGLLTSSVTRAGLANAIEGSIQQVIAVSALQEMQQNEALQRLPETARTALDQAMDWESALESGVSPTVQLQRVMAGLQVVDEILHRQDQLAVENGQQERPQYVRGRVIQQFNVGLQNRLLTSQALAQDGVLDRGSAFLLTEFIGARRPVEQFGEQALSFEDLVPTATEIVMGNLRSQMSAHETLAIGGVIRVASREVNGLLYSPSYGDETQVAIEPQERQIAEMAALNLFVRKAVDPTADQSTVFGLPLPSFGRGLGSTARPARSWARTIATQDEIILEIENMGYADIAQRMRERIN